jgi:GNAT superfamily N-acetyltransferase
MNPLSLPNLSPAELAAAANANLVTHASWVQQRTAGMRVLVEDDLVLVDSGLACDTFNLVCRAQLAQTNAPERIRAAIDYFAQVNRPFSWWLNPGDAPTELGDLLLEAGLHRAETERAMAANLDQLPHGNVVPHYLRPNNLRIERVCTTRQLYDFATIVAANWTPPDREVMRFYERAMVALLGDNDPALWLYVGYVGDVAVATAELTIGGGVVGLYSVCTLESYRRRGFGSALTLRPLLDARAFGFHTAILQSAADSVYARLGFVPFGEITEYKP